MDPWIGFAGFQGVHRVFQPTAASGLDFVEHPGDYSWFPGASGLEFVNFPGHCWDLPVGAFVNLSTIQVLIASTLSARPDQLQLGADSDPSQVIDVQQDMNASYSTLQNIFAHTGESQTSPPPQLPQDSSCTIIYLVLSWLIWAKLELIVRECRRT